MFEIDSFEGSLLSSGGGEGTEVLSGGGDFWKSLFSNLLTTIGFNRYYPGLVNPNSEHHLISPHNITA